MDVRSKWDLVTYGNGAGLSMWWHQAQYRRTLHHVNQKDVVPNTFGINPAQAEILGDSWYDAMLSGINFNIQVYGADVQGTLTVDR